MAEKVETTKNNLDDNRVARMDEGANVLHDIQTEAQRFLANNTAGFVKAQALAFATGGETAAMLLLLDVLQRANERLK